MKNIILHMLAPYAVLFIAGYLLAGLIARKRYGPRPRHERVVEKDPIGVMDKILVIELIAIILYVTVDFIVFWHIGSEPSTLTMSFFAVCGGENGFMAWIKTRKEQERMRKWQMEDMDKADEYKADKTL